MSSNRRRWLVEYYPIVEKGFEADSDKKEAVGAI